MSEANQEHPEASSKLRVLLVKPPEGLPPPEAENLKAREVPLKNPEMKKFRMDLEKIEGPVRTLIAEHWEKYNWAEKQGLKAGWCLTNSYSSDALAYVKTADAAWGTGLAVDTLKRLATRTDSYLDQAALMVDTGQAVPLLTDFGKGKLKDLGVLITSARKELMPKIEALTAEALSKTSA